MKRRKCPHCKSKKGFVVCIELKGYQYDTFDFKGNLIESDRQGVDDVEKWVCCIDCDKTIPIEQVKTNQH